VPGLSGILVSIGEFDVDILRRMASDNLARRISISASWDPAERSSDEPIFMEFAAQRQSVFVASGDCGSYVPGAVGECGNGGGQYPPQYPQEDADVTTVGGTVLTTVRTGRRLDFGDRLGQPERSGPDQSVGIAGAGCRRVASISRVCMELRSMALSLNTAIARAIRPIAAAPQRP